MGRLPVTLSKITRPTYSGIYPWRRLYSALDKLRNHLAVWISAPPGSGKSTLVSSYLESRKLPSLWYQTDGGDADPATFFHYLGLAGKKASPRKKPLPPLTPEYLPSLPTFTRRYFEQLFDRLKTPACLVFDNCQEVPADSPFHEILRIAIETTPGGIRIFLISREAPPPLFARLVIHRRLGLLDSSQLLLTPKESLELLKGREGVRLSRESLGKIYRKTEGWVAGLVLLAKTVSENGITGVQNLSTETISHYFATEILRNLDEESRSFLLKTALFPSMDSAMAERLTGRPDAGEILSRMSRSHCFTERRLLATPSYQYHPLFREFLLRSLVDSLPATDLSRLRREAGAILEGAGMAEDAFALYREAKADDEMARMIMEQARPLLGQNRSGLLEQWIGAIPPETVEGHPWLLYWLGTCRLPYNPPEARESIEKAFLLFREAGDPVGTLLAWSGVVSSKTFSVIGLADLDRWIALLDDLVAEFRGFPSEEIEFLVALNMVAAIGFRYPGHPKADHWAERAYRLLDTVDPGIGIHAIVFLVTLKQVRGDAHAGKALLSRLKEILKSNPASPLAELTLYWQEAVFFILTGEPDRCLEFVRKGLDLAESSGVHLMDMMLLGHGALAAFNSGDFKTGDKFLESMETRMAHSRIFDQSFYHFNRVHQAILMNDWTMASALSKIASEQIQEVGFPMTTSFIDFQKAFIAKKLKKEKEAEDYLRKAYRAVERGYRYNELLCLILESFFAFEDGKNIKGEKSLRKALALCRDFGVFSLYIWIPEVMEKICARALDTGIEVEYIRELIQKRKIVPRSPATLSDHWPWPVKVFTLGRFKLVRDDKPVVLSPKAMGKPIDLLKALIVLGGRNVPQDRVIDLLWPAAEGDAAYRSLITNLYRLRKIIGHETITFHEGALTIDPNRCWVDLWAVKGHLGSTEKTISGKGYTEESVRWLEKTIKIYKGNFLPEDESKPWTSGCRDRMRNKILAILGNTGRHFTAIGKDERALPFFQKALEIDPASEAACQNLMLSYHRLGRRGEAVAAYRRLEKVLAETIGVTASDKTQAIYQEVSGGH